MEFARSTTIKIDHFFNELVFLMVWVLMLVLVPVLFQILELVLVLDKNMGLTLVYDVVDFFVISARITIKIL